MVPPEGNASDPLSPAAERVQREILDDPHGHDLFQLLRRLDRLDPSVPRIGTAPRAAAERVRLEQPADLSFAPSSVQAVRVDDEGRMHVAQRVFGLLGPNGPLPVHLTEYVRDRTLNHRDETLQAFLDVFHHRMTTLFYRAWAENQATVSREHPDDDRFAAFTAALVGLADESFAGRDAVADDERRFHAGRLTCRTTNATGLQQILADVLRVPARVEEFAGTWMALPESTHCRLGRDPIAAGLGSAVVGRRIRDPQHAFRIVLGPLSKDELVRFLPIGGDFVRLRDWVRTYAGRAYAWDVQMVVRADEVPVTRLGDGAWLGWTTWVRSQPATRDDDRLVFTGES